MGTPAAQSTSIGISIRLLLAENLHNVASNGLALKPL